MIATTKLAVAVVAETALIVGQTADPNGLIPASVLDAGTTVAALGLLAYILRKTFSGDLVTRSTIDGIVEKAVRETLREMDRER